MRLTIGLAFLAATTGILAQSTSTSTVEVWLETCTETDYGTQTITQTIIQTTCPSDDCADATSSMGPVHTTVYTTLYDIICSTGLTQATYTVTETCTGETPVWPTPDPTYVPPGFTTMETVCEPCHHSTATEGPPTVTLTVPCDGGCGEPTPDPQPSWTDEPPMTDDTTITTTECPDTTTMCSHVSSSSTHHCPGTEVCHHNTTSPMATSSPTMYSAGVAPMATAAVGLIGGLMAMGVVIVL